MQKAIEINGLRKNYKDFTLGPLELDLKQGSVMGFVGHNGAGKTTTILSLAGLLRADSGSFKILGETININDGEWKKNIGYVGDAGSFFGMWKAQENLNFISKFFPSWDKKYENELLERLELKTDKKVVALSAGNKMKLQIVSVLARRPKVLLFDEPANGLDPVARDEFISILFEYMENGQNSIIYSTHIISEIARLADEFTFISEGAIIGDFDKEVLLSKWNEIIVNKDLSAVKIPGAERIESDGRISKIICAETEKAKEFLTASNIEIANIAPISIEDVAINILKRKKKWQKP